MNENCFALQTTIPGPYFMNFLYQYFENVLNKLECLGLASLSRAVYFLRVRLEPTRVKHVSGTSLYSNLQTVDWSEKAYLGQTL
jgi:hypothetical protein